MTGTAQNRIRAATVAGAPLILAAGFLYHPYIANLTDEAAAAQAAAADTTRWGIAHLAVGVGSAALVLAFLAIRSYLREAGEDRWSPLAVPFVVVGGTLYAILPGMEFTLLAAVKTGADVAASQAALDPWFMPTLLSAAFLSAIGFIGFALGVARSHVLSPWLTRLVVVALIAIAIARFVPLGAVQFYVQSAVIILALWPLALKMAGTAVAKQVHQPLPASP
jgi:hypothetical protein